jgi:hypothetical protein
MQDRHLWETRSRVLPPAAAAPVTTLAAVADATEGR